MSVKLQAGVKSPSRTGLQIPSGMAGKPETLRTGLQIPSGMAGLQIPSGMVSKVMKRKKASSGFTLLEILIAIFIFSIIVTTIFGSFTSVFSNAETISKGIGSYEMGKNCLNRMIFDLKSMHVSPDAEYARPSLNDTPDPYRVVGDTSYAGTASFSRLRFTSLSHVSLEKSTRDGIAEIVYYVQSQDDEQYVLRRADSLYPYKRFDGKNFEEQFADPALCEGVKSLIFIYYDEEGTEYDYWDSESSEFKYATPSAIKIKLEFGDDYSSLFFETMVDLPIYRMAVT